jgi:hypothetical protein
MQGNPKSRKKFSSLLALLSTQKKENKKHKLTQKKGKKTQTHPKVTTCHLHQILFCM